MPPAKPVQSRPFIVSTDLEKIDAKSRKLIRSHVMRGVNQKKTQYGNSGPGDNEVNNTTAGFDHQLVSTNHFSLPIPRRVGSDVSFITFPDAIDSQAAVEALKYSIPFSRAKYVLESCLIFNKVDGPLVEQLQQDALFSQSAIFMAQNYLDMMGGRGCNLPSRKHLRTLQLLRERLSCVDASVQTVDSTVFVAVNLAFYAHMAGQTESAMVHLKGIRKILDIKGGLKNLAKPRLGKNLCQIKLLIEVLRFDIMTVLNTGAEPLFSSEIELLLQYRNDTFSPSERNRALEELEDLDDDIAKGWQLMTKFCSQTNLAAEAHGRITWEVFLYTMASIIYRLLGLSFGVGTANEAIRLALLALSSDLFLQWKVVKVNYHHLSVSYRNCLNNLESPTCVPPYLYSWLLMIGAVSVFKQQDDTWLRPLLSANLESCGVKTWMEMRDVLKSLLWVPLVQDRPGKDFFDSVLETE